MRNFKWFSALACALLALSVQARVVDNGGYRYEVEPQLERFVQNQVASEWPERYHSDAPYRVWLLDNQEVLDVGSYLDYVFEARTASSLQSVANYTIDFAPSWQRLVIHELSVLRDGQWQDRYTDSSVTLTRRESSFETGIYDGQVSALIVFKDVAINEPIRVRYSLLGTHPLLKGVDGVRYILGWDSPVLERRIQVHAAKGQTLVHQIAGRETEFKLPAGALRLQESQVSLHLREVPTIRRIDMLPRDQEAFPYLSVAPKQSWADIQARAKTWFAQAFAAPSMEVKALAEKLSTQVNPTTDPRGFSLLALRHVQEQVRYFAVLIDQSTHRPHPPTEVLARAYGDCKDKSQLLTALLRAEGIDATPVLVSVGRQKLLAKDLPDVGNFDHAIVLVRIGAQSYWLDPTITEQGGTLDSQGFADYGYALPVLSDKPISALVAMERPALAGNTSRSIETFTVNSRADTELEIESTYASHTAESMRGRFANQGKRRIASEYKNFYERVFGKLTDDALTFSDYLESNEFKISERYRFSALWNESKGENYADFSAQSARSTLNLPDVVERDVGLRIYHPVSTRELIRIKLPKDAEFVSSLSDVDVSDPAFVYARKVSTKGNVLEIEHTLQSKTDSVEPRDLAAHIERRRTALDALSQRVFWKFKNASSRDSESETAARQARYRDLLEKLRKEKQ